MLKYAFILLTCLVLVHGTPSGYAQCTTCGSTAVYVGTNAGKNVSTGQRDTFIGRSAGEQNKNGSSNTAVGYYAGSGNVAGHSNSFFGRESGRYSKGHFNSFFGSESGFATTTGTSNSFFGFQAGYLNGTGSHNSFFGTSAGYNHRQGHYNSFFGSQAGSKNSGSYNVYVGAHSGSSMRASNRNVFVGAHAGGLTETGEYNTFLGSAAGINNNGSRNVFVGYQAGAKEQGSDKLYIANSEEHAPLIYGDFKIGRVGYNTTEPQDELHVKDGADANTSATIFVQPQEWDSVGDFGEIRIGDPYHFIRGEFGNGMIINDFNKIDFRTGGVKSKTRMFIDYNGNVGIGINHRQPKANLHVKGSLRLEGLNAGSGQPLVIDSKGNVKVGQASQLQKVSDSSTSSEIAILKQKVAELETALADLKNQSLPTKARLYPNAPNPFDQETEIRFFLEPSTREAHLFLYDYQGNQLKKIKLDKRGEATVHFQAAQLQAGIYYYTLVANGQEVATRRMLITD